ncbi:MAG TPA: hypothetical protein PLB89_14570 [Flavobacteriales bacterium]|nr:hypothetical protein [Flavobacteriales bacterium]
MRHIAILAVLALLTGCSQETGTTTPPAAVVPEDTAPPPPSSPSTAERDAWQKPQEIFNLMGNDFRGQTVADLAARDGYFTFKLIEVGANVIAIDDDPVNIAALEARKKEMGLGDDRLKIRLASIGDPGLAKDEVDAALLVHGLVRIPNKKDYLSKVFAGTREPRPLFIVEWLNVQTPLGPPLTDRMSSESIMDEVGLAGYTDVGAYSAKIPYQVFLFASYQVGDPGDMPQDAPMMEIPSQ